VSEADKRHEAREVGMARLDEWDFDPEHGIFLPPPERRPLIRVRIEAAIAVAHSEWKSKVFEPGRGYDAPAHDPAYERRIDEYIRGPYGLHWPGAKMGPNGLLREPYRKNGDFAWCGAFVAFCYGCVGLKREIRHSIFPSTERIYSWARGKVTRGVDPGGDRRVEIKDIQRGDIVIVGRNPSLSKKPAGDHITLAISGIDRGSIDTYEGNARGILGDARFGEGVIHHERPRSAARDKDYRVLYGVRLDASDFD
jgi:hypothetical protein